MRKKNEDNTDVKTFSSMAFVHLQLQHSSCTTHLTILHTVHNIEIFKLKFLSLIYCTQIWKPEKKKEKRVVTYVHYISGITNTYTTGYQKIQREKLHAGSVNHKSHFLFSLFGETLGNKFYSVLHNSIYRYIKLWSWLMTACCNKSVSALLLHHSGFSCILGRKGIPNTLHVVLAHILQLGCAASLVPTITWKTLTYFIPLRGVWCQQQLHLTSQVISSAAEHLSMHAGRKTDRSVFITNATPGIFFILHSSYNSYSNTSHAVPLHIRMFSMLWPCGHFANRSGGGGMGFQEMPPPQTPTGRLSDPAPHQSGAGRSLWPPNRRC